MLTVLNTPPVGTITYLAEFEISRRPDDCLRRRAAGHRKRDASGGQRAFTWWVDFAIRTPIRSCRRRRIDVGIVRHPDE